MTRFNMHCWICGKHGETGEHKIKKSLLIAVHGKGPYKGEGAMAHVKAGTASDLQGPNSEKIKYVNCLCSDCNNRRTQPFDMAYDLFVRFVVDHETDVLHRRMIDFHDIYGADFEKGQRDLFKYFVKLLGCDLSDSGFPVPEDLRILLDQDEFITRLKVTFAVNEDKLLLPDATVRPIGVGGLITSNRNLSHKDDPVYRWSTSFSFLHVFYWYFMEPDGRFGATWVGDSQYIYLGSYHSLTEEQREEFKRMLRTRLYDTRGNA